MSPSRSSCWLSKFLDCRFQVFTTQIIGTKRFVQISILKASGKSWIRCWECMSLSRINKSIGFTNFKLRNPNSQLQDISDFYPKVNFLSIFFISKINCAAQKFNILARWTARLPFRPIRRLVEKYLWDHLIKGVYKTQKQFNSSPKYS